MENKHLGRIYYLQNPITNEIFYVGSTTKSLEERLKIHYYHLLAYKRGERQNTKRFEYLINLGDIKATIHLIEEVDLTLLDEKEKFYIQQYKELYPNLVNIQKGGKGGDNYTNNTEERKKEISSKISNALKGKPKPEGFKERLSETRKGQDNPNCKELTEWIVVNNTILFKFAYQLNNYIGSKDACGNVKKSLKKGKGNPYNKNWCLFSNLSKELQDIVHSNYESSYNNTAR